MFPPRADAFLMQLGLNIVDVDIAVFIVQFLQDVLVGLSGSEVGVEGQFCFALGCESAGGECHPLY